MRDKEIKPTKSIDCIGLFCPMPVVRTKLELETMKPGDILEVVADDPGFEKDFPAWCSASGEEFLGIVKEGNIIKGYVRKK